MCLLSTGSLVRIQYVIPELRCIIEEKLVDIPGFPRYKLRPSDMNVISYCQVPSGYTLKVQNNGYGALGYRMWADGKDKFFTLNDLLVIVERDKLMKEVSKMNAGGTVKSGEYIVGSINKSTKELSTSQFPARHSTLLEAKNEAGRLANLHKERKFVVLKVEAIASVENVTWE